MANNMKVSQIAEKVHPELSGKELLAQFGGYNFDIFLLDYLRKVTKTV